MVFLIKNKVVSAENAARISISPAGRVAKRFTQSLRNADVPRAKSSPHINLVAEGGSLKPSPKHRVETARRPSGSISVKPASPTTTSTVGSSTTIISSSPVNSDAACSDQWEEDEDHCHRLLAVAQSWLDFDRVFPKRCANSAQTTEQARRDFCHDLIGAFSGCSPASSPLQADSDSLSSVSSPHLSSQAPFATPLTGQTTVASVAAKPARSPECPEEELQRESDNFSFHFSQDEEWTPEVEARMQAAIDRMLEDARRQLAVPFPNFSVLFPDDILAGSVASSLEDYHTSYSVDHEDETEGGDCTSVKEQDDAESVVEGIDNVWEELATYVPARPLTPSSEESLAEEFAVEEDAHSPPLSFKHATSPSSTHGDMTEVSSTAASTSLVTRVPAAATAGKTLAPARKFVDLKSTSSIETLCETISVHEEDCHGRHIRRVPGCIDLRKGFGGSDVYIETSPSLASCFSFEERQCLSDLDEGPIVQITTKTSAEPPIAPKPPDVYLRRRRRRWKPPDPYLRRKR